MKWIEKFAIWYAQWALFIFPPSDDEYKHSDYEDRDNG